MRVAALLLLSAAPAFALPVARLSAAAVRLDGIRLGDRYATTVMNRAPYEEPCDNDPIDRRARRFMVYGGLPCRGRSFPQATTVAFYLAYSEADRYGQPIEAIAWLGGHYFDARSNFPLHPGEPAARSIDVLGAPVGTFGLGPLLVQRHAGDIAVLVEAGRLVGFVVGPMPADSQSEQWQGLLQMYVRYTPHP